MSGRQAKRQRRQVAAIRKELAQMLGRDYRSAVRRAPDGRRTTFRAGL